MTRLGWTLLPLACSLAGCAGLLHSAQPALQLYVLQPEVAPSAPPGAVSSGPTLRLARPLPAPGLDTDRIALLRPGGRLDYYAGSRWSAPLAQVVSALQLSVFRADPAWRAVADERSSFNTDYVLQTSIDGFAAEYATDAASPLVRVTLHCLLIRRSDGMLLGSFTVAGSQPAQENRMGSVIAAFSTAAGQAAAAAATQADALLRSATLPAIP